MRRNENGTRVVVASKKPFELRDENHVLSALKLDVYPRLRFIFGRIKGEDLELLPDEQVKKYFQQTSPSYTEPVQTPCNKSQQQRRMSPLLSQSQAEDEEKPFVKGEDILQTQIRGGQSIDFHLTPNYQRLSRSDSPYDVDASKEYYMNEHRIYLSVDDGVDIVSPFRSINKQLFRASVGPETDEVARKLF